MVRMTLKKRDLYLDHMISFQDTEMIKVMTGIRRCGKSSLMKLMANHLREQGIQNEQIIEKQLMMFRGCSGLKKSYGPVNISSTVN